MNVPGRKIFKGESFYTDWQPRGGDGAILRGQVISEFKDGATGITVEIKVYTKNSEATTNQDGTAISGFQLDLDGTSNAVIEEIFEPAGAGAGVKEEIRFKVYTNATDGTDGDWLLLRTFGLLWFEGAR